MLIEASLYRLPLIWMLLFSIVLSSCSSDKKKSEAKNNACHVLNHINSFDIACLISPYEAIDKESVLICVENSLKKLGTTHISKGSLDSIALEPLESAMTALLSIGNISGQLQASLTLSAPVNIISNNCQTVCAVWKKTHYASIENEKDKTESAKTLVEELLSEFATDYTQANAASLKPTFTLKVYTEN